MYTKSLHSGSKSLTAKLTCFLALLIFPLSISTLSAQTFVTGGIYSSTTWTLAGSPYILSDTVVVFSNVKVTIQPGVVVKFNNNALMEVWGSLSAIGTSADSIIFTSNSATPYAGIYNGITTTYNSDTLSFRYCRFSYANTSFMNNQESYNDPIISHCLFNSDLTGVDVSMGYTQSFDTCTFMYDSVGISPGGIFGDVIGCEFRHNFQAIGGVGGSISMTANSVFENNEYAIYGLAGGDDTLTNCIIDSNDYGVSMAQRIITHCIIKYNGTGIETEESYVAYNDISDNGIGITSWYGTTMEMNSISNNHIGIESTSDIISCNTICNNTLYSIEALMVSNELANNNYWCLTDSAQIQATIYDAYQNINIGFVFFTPFDTVPCVAPCNLTVTASATQTIVCAGNPTTLTANITDANPVHTAVWNPGNYTGNSYTVTPLANTTYTVVVTDSSGCSNTAYITIDTSCSTPPPNCNLYVSAFASPNIVCSGSPSTLNAIVFDSNTVYTAIWNPGSHSGTTYTVTPSANTTYTVVVTDSSGCTATAFVTVDTMYCTPPSPCSSLYPPSICYVTTDTSSTFNTVVWQKTGMDTLAIDSVIIYRQNVLNVFVPIGEVSVHAFSTYRDYGAHPLVEPSFYTLGIHDTCGSDTSMSNFNETVFLQSVASGPNKVNLSWNFYQGNPVIYYRILRDDSGIGNWQAIDSVQGTINAYTDLNAPVNPGLRYLISVDWNVVCTPSIIHPRHGSRYAFASNGEYSNVTKVFPTGIVNLADNGSIKVYPNPVNDVISISFNNVFEGMVKITDVLGQDVYTSNLSVDNGSVKKLNVNMLSNGVYFIILEGKGESYRTKIIKM